MANQGILHITPVEGGTWALKPGEDSPADSVHPTEGQAIASVYDLVPEPGEVEIIVHDSEGGIRSNLTIRRYGPSDPQVDDEDRDDPALLAEAVRITPSSARLQAGIARRLPVEGADLDADPADLY